MTAYHSLDQAWFETAKALDAHGAYRSCRNGGSVEFVGHSFSIAHPRNNWVLTEGRRISFEYAHAELLWYLSGSRDGSIMAKYAPQYANFLDEDGRTAYGAYGYRWAQHQQLEKMVRILRKDPWSRQAVMTCWNVHDLDVYGHTKDMPCTLSLQFLVTHEADPHLNCVVTMRSNDVWLGLPYDAYCFTMIQMILAADLGLKVGTYTHNVGSIHLYEKDRKKVRDCVPHKTTECAELSFGIAPLATAHRAGQAFRNMHLDGKKPGDDFPAVWSNMLLTLWNEEKWKQ